jgi:hypothetical protein
LLKTHLNKKQNPQINTQSSRHFFIFFIFFIPFGTHSINILAPGANPDFKVDNFFFFFNFFMIMETLVALRELSKLKTHFFVTFFLKKNETHHFFIFFALNSPYWTLDGDKKKQRKRKLTV